MPPHGPIQIHLPNHVIDHADERAAFFFVSNVNSVGPSACDRRAASLANPPDQFAGADVYAINTTMMARTGYTHWVQFTKSPAPLPWLQALDTSWDLFTMDDQAWMAAKCETQILAALTALMAPYRTTSITIKLLHLKRPALIPICDSYICAMVGKRAGNAADTAELIVTVREVGRANLDALQEISRRLRGIGINRTLVRILDSVLWSAYRKEEPDAEFARWLVHWHGGRLLF